jgi:hypothetical protein
MTMSYERLWWDFLREMEPLREHPLGPFCTTDIVRVIGHMQHECREGKASWALRPTHILRNPENFFDLVLMTREKYAKRALAPKAPPVKKPETPPEDLLSSEEVLDQLARLKHQINGGAA